jgi:hypothetical protein
MGLLSIIQQEELDHEQTTQKEHRPKQAMHHVIIGSVVCLIKKKLILHSRRIEEASTMLAVGYKTMQTVGSRRGRSKKLDRQTLLLCDLSTVVVFG